MDSVTELFAPYPPEVRELAAQARALMRELIPDAAEEVDTKPPLLGYTYRPGTYTGLILAIMPQKSYVNVVFSKGVELLELDSAGLLEGTGWLRSNAIEHAEPGGVSCTTRKSSPARWSTSSVKPALSR